MMILLHLLMDFWAGDFPAMLPSGKRLQKTMEHHHF